MLYPTDAQAALQKWDRGEQLTDSELEALRREGAAVTARADRKDALAAEAAEEEHNSLARAIAQAMRAATPATGAARKRKARKSTSSRRGRLPSNPERKALVSVLLKAGEKSVSRIHTTLERYAEHAAFEDGLTLDLSYDKIRNDVIFLKDGGAICDNAATIRNFKKWFKSQGA